MEHTPVNSIPADADVVVCHAGLAARARVDRARTRRDRPFQVFLGDPAVTKLVNAIKNGGDRRCLRRRPARPARHPAARSAPTAATTRSASAGEALVDVGAVDAAYVEAMLERERSISTYVGEGVAIPHGTAGRQGGRPAATRSRACASPTASTGTATQVTVCVGIAAAGDGHVRLLAQLAEILLDPDQAQALREATEVAEVVRLLQPTERRGRLT